MPFAPTDNFLELLSDAIAQLLTGDEARAAVTAESLSPGPLPVRRTRPALAPTLAAAIFRRDGFHCRYCDARVVPVPVLRAASLVWPDQIPFNPNWRADVTHPIYVSRSATVDHVNPHAHGGEDSSLDNLVTACWPCNIQKGEFRLDRLGWSLLPENRDDWDGLISSYPTLWSFGRVRAGDADTTFHTRWLKALSLTN